MNDTNNTSENNLNNTAGVNSVPVQNVDTSQQEQAVQGVTQITAEQQSQNVQVTQPEGDAQLNSISQSSDSDENLNNKVDDGSKNENVISKSEEEVKNAKLRFPVIVSILIIVFIVVFIIYYFFITNPNNIYNKVLKTSVDRILGLVNISNTDEAFSNTEISVTLDTDSVDFESKPHLSYIDGLTYKVNFNRDNKNGNYQLMVKDNLSDIDSSSQFTFSNPLVSDMYYMGSNIYSKPQNNFISLRNNLGEKENSSIYSLVAEYLYEVIDNLNLDKVDRKFATKKVNNQTLLAIKYELNYNASDLQKLSEVTTNNILDTSKHSDFVKKLANLTDMDEAGIKNLLKSIENLNKDTESVKFNYYMNISFTNIICMEMITDNMTFSISYLNDYYFINYSDKDSSVKFDINVNFANLDINGDIVFDTKDGYSHLVIGTDYKINNKTYKLDNNVITFKVYEEDKDKPYMSIVVNMNHDYSEKIVKENSIKSIGIDSATAEEIELIEYASKKISYDLSYLMVLLTKNKMGVDIKDILSNMNNGSVDDNFNQSDNNVSEPSVDVPVVDENLDNSVDISTPSE